MRVSRAKARENHQAVINAASQLFRERGFDGIGLKELMKGAGLTQGGFYKQFTSKEDLVKQAVRRSMEVATRRWSDASAANPETRLEAVISFYLSLEHVQERGQGCPLVALGSDGARQSEDVKALFEAGVKAHLSVLDELAPSSEHETPYAKAMVVLSLMVGALTLSRVVNDQILAEDILHAAAAEILHLASS